MKDSVHRPSQCRTAGHRRISTAILALLVMAGLVTVMVPAAIAAGSGAVAASASQTPSSTESLWHLVTGPLADPKDGHQAVIHASRFRTFTLDRAGMQVALATAPREFTTAARQHPLVFSIPAPDGGFQRFKVQESPVMEPGLALKHPEIKTYNGRGIDDPTATVRLDLTPLGFHASVRGQHGSWYIDPYYHLDQSLYATYFGRDLTADPHGTYVEREGPGGGTTKIYADQPGFHAGDPVLLHGDGFAADATVTITISDTLGELDPRTVDAVANGTGSFDASFAADPDGNLGTRGVDATDGTNSASTFYEVVDNSEPVDPPVGDQLRTYRLALVSDPSYATYFGAANVTAAKVSLINRVDQFYEDETSIRLVLVASNDNVNLNTTAQATGTNGPCGGLACFTTGQLASCGSATLTANRLVIGKLIGASNYDIGHIVVGQNGGGIASLGVVGRSAKAQGCTGIPQPDGDFFAIDYVAHEMGHEFGGNHPFNGVTLNCSSGNRNASTSVEPGSGSSVMAYAGICGTDDLQPHSDPYWSQRSFDEITTYTASNQNAINEVEIGALTGFNTNGYSFKVRYNGVDSAAIVRGTNYTTAGVSAAISALTGGTVTITALTDNGFTVTFSGTLAATNVNNLSLTNATGAGFSGYMGEVDKGGAVDNKGNTITPTGNHFPVVTAPTSFTIPFRTPFSLTGSATDVDGDTVTYMWEQNDRGGTAGTSLVSNTKTNGPLFRQFGTRLDSSIYDPHQYNSPGENAVTTDPTRVFPDMEQILANNTNADTGTCPTAGPAPVAPAIVDCYSEFLPTSAYVGLAGTNTAPLRLDFRLTARDGHPGGGGVNNAATQVLLAAGTGPFLVTSPNTAVSLDGGSTPTVTWSVAGTNTAALALNVKISLSTDGGHTYPYVLAASTPNDGSEPVTLPNVGTTQARVKIEGVGNIFFDVSNANFTIKANQTITFAAIPDHTYLDPDFAVSPTASSGLTVSLSASGQCTLDSATSPANVHITAPGSCSITASQAGSTIYNPAPDVVQSFNIAKANQTITFAAIPDHTYLDPDFAVSPTASSGLTVSLSASGQCTLDSATSPANVHITGAGSCSITASQGGDSNYKPALDVVQSFAIARANQFITFAAIPNHTYGDPDFAVSPTASSGLTVSLSASGQCSLDSATAPANVHITGAVSCSITASQGGDPNYNPALDVVQSFNVAKAALSVTADNKSKIMGAANPPLTGVITGIQYGDNITAAYSTPAITVSPAGFYPIIPSLVDPDGKLVNYNITSTNGTLTVLYATGTCLGSPGRTVLQPVNFNGSSVFKQKSTVPVKFRVCDVNGNSIGTAGVVTGDGAPILVSKTSGAGGIDEAVVSTTPDTAFRWDATAQQWIFNQSTKNLKAGVIYTYMIPLNDGTAIIYTFGVN